MAKVKDEVKSKDRAKGVSEAVKTKLLKKIEEYEEQVLELSIALEKTRNELKESDRQLRWFKSNG